MKDRQLAVLFGEAAAVFAASGAAVISGAIFGFALALCGNAVRLSRKDNDR